jgi:tetratricopeptide (TPR) repeat protein
MIRFRHVVTAAVFLSLTASVLLADGAGPRWQRLDRRARELRSRGEYDRAVAVAKEAIRLAEKEAGPDHPDVARSLNRLAGLYGVQGRYVEAQPLYERALAIRETALGPDHPALATSLNNLGLLHHRRGRYAEA